MSHRRATVLIAPDKFKGTLSAPDVARSIRQGLLASHPGIRTVLLPVADGGDGTLDVFVNQGYERRPIRVTGPDGTSRHSAFALRADTAVVETAQTSGLAMLGGRLDALGSTSRGVGEAMLAAVDAGASRIILGLGGSACTDGGAGMLQALGGSLEDSQGEDLRPGGRGLLDLTSADLSGIDPRILSAEIVLATDVTNPLCGQQGAARVYGPQKGAAASDVDLLDRGLRRLADLLSPTLADSPGAGAAGGIGFGAMAALGAVARPGIGLVMQMLGFSSSLAEADLVITGEGRLDQQSFLGKAPSGVLEAAEAQGVPCIAVCGASELGTSRSGLHSGGERFQGVYALTDIEPDRERCEREAGRLLALLASEIRLPG